MKFLEFSGIILNGESQLYFHVDTKQYLVHFQFQKNVATALYSGCNSTHLLQIIVTHMQTRTHSHTHLGPCLFSHHFANTSNKNVLNDNDSAGVSF